MADPHNTATAEAAADAYEYEHAPYRHGGMEIQEQVATFALFLNLSKWSTVACLAAILFLTLWFGVGSGFVGAAVVTFVFTALCVFFLRSKPKAH